MIVSFYSLVTKLNDEIFLEKLKRRGYSKFRLRSCIVIV